MLNFPHQQGLRNCAYDLLRSPLSESKKLVVTQQYPFLGDET